MEEHVGDKILAHLTDYTKDDLKNIINDSIQPYGSKYQKINIYNKNINVPLQKIWLLMPKVKIFKNVTLYNNTKNTFPLTVILGPNAGLIKKFYMFIKKIERHVQTIVKAITKKKTLQIKPSTKSAEGFPPLMNLKMPSTKIGDNCYELKFQIYNGNQQRTSITSITQGTYAMAFIELTDIWISDTEFGFNWSILQLQLFPEFNFSEFLFKDNKSDEQEQGNNGTEECYHCLYCPNAHVRTHVCGNSFSNTTNMSFLPPPPPPPPPTFSFKNMDKSSSGNDMDKKKSSEPAKGFSISIDQLLSIKLKSINKNKEKEPDPITTNSDLEMLSIRNNLKQNKSTSSEEEQE